MSRDIRSYFQKKPQKPKVENDDDDDDVIPESPQIPIKNKKKETRKRQVIVDDSDEEIFSTKKQTSSDSSKKQTKVKGKLPQKPALKEVKAADIFGSAKIKRTEPLVKRTKKNTEIGIHSDEDIDKTLLELDVDKDFKAIEKFKSPSRKSNEKNEIAGSSMTMKLVKEEKKSPVKIDRKKTQETEGKITKTDTKVQKTEDSKSPMKNDSKILQNIVGTSKSSNETEKVNKEKFKSPSKTEKTAQSNGTKNQDSKSKTNIIKNEDLGISKKRSFDEYNERHETRDDKLKIKKKRLNSNADDETVNKSNESCKKEKTDFSEFLEGDVSMNESCSDDQIKGKKKKADKSLNESVLTDEERFERKRHSAALYQKYLNRSGPQHLGSKQIPEGTPDCLKDCAFLLTGVMDSFEREEIVEAIKKFGGCVKNAISKKVTHVLAGEDAGPAKMAKAQDLGIKVINEDEFLQMITELSNKQNGYKLEVKERKRSPRKSAKESSQIKNEKDSKKSPKKTVKNVKKDKINEELQRIREGKIRSPNKRAKKNDDEKEVVNDVKIENTTKQDNTSIWVDKYKPQNLKQIIGQHGDASNVKKLCSWLNKWYINRKAKIPKPNPWAKNDDGAFYKAALLSGPPGVGKTTTVSLVCKELGFDMVEFNASDTRNKTLIKEQIGELLITNSLSAYAKGDTSKQAVTKKHVLVMDEVDGMAGNEDRGGLQELIALIKSTAVPIICMCNDRNSQKMRSLVNYCYDLRFNRPRVDQIKSAMMSICFKEGMKIPPDALTQLIVAANQDVRQTINLLSMWAVDPALADGERLRKDAQKIKKDIKLGPWEAVRKVFTMAEHKNMSLNDKSDLFFYDYSLSPLFVQENYLHVAPHCPKHEVLQRISKTADSISLGDMVESRIRRNQAWNLLPIQAMYSSVIPGHEMSGHVTAQIQFPGWLGKNSRANKMHRLCQEIHSHTRLSTSGSKSSIYLDYCSYLRDAIVNPLIKKKADGIEESMEVLESYHLLREDLDSLTELSMWPGQRDPMILVDSKVKAAMTRTYNKKATALPYAPGAVKRGRMRDDDEMDDGDMQEDVEEDNDPENDVLIKKKKQTEKASNSKEKRKRK